MLAAPTRIAPGNRGGRVVWNSRGRGRPVRQRAAPGHRRAGPGGVRGALPPVRPLGVRRRAPGDRPGPDRAGGGPGGLPRAVAGARGVRRRPGAPSAPSSCPWSIIGRSTRSGGRSGSASAPTARRTSSPRRTKTLRRTSSRTPTSPCAGKRSATRSRPCRRTSDGCSRWPTSEGMTQVKIAEALGIPVGTVKTRTLAAMRKLRAALQEA